MSRACFFARFGWGDCEWRADGQPDPAHLIPKQRIKETFKRRREAVPDLWDERLVVPACRHHHDLFDRKLRRLELGDFPPPLLAWAQQHGFSYDETRGEWRASAVSHA